MEKPPQLIMYIIAFAAGYIFTFLTSFFKQSGKTLSDKSHINSIKELTEATASINSDLSTNSAIKIEKYKSQQRSFLELSEIVSRFKSTIANTQKIYFYYNKQKKQQSLEAIQDHTRTLNILLTKLSNCSNRNVHLFPKELLNIINNITENTISFVTNYESFPDHSDIYEAILKLMSLQNLIFENIDNSISIMRKHTN